MKKIMNKYNLVLLISIVMTLCCSLNVSAVSDEIKEKAALGAIYEECYGRTWDEYGLKEEIELNDFGKISDVARSDNKNYVPLISTSTRPENFTNCYKAMTTTSNGLKNAFPTGSISGVEQKQTALENMGYVKTRGGGNTSEGDYCHSFEYVREVKHTVIATNQVTNQKEIFSSNSLCLRKQSEGFYAYQVEMEGSGDVFNSYHNDRISFSISSKKFIIKVDGDGKNIDASSYLPGGGSGSSFSNERELMEYLGNQIAGSMGANANESKLHNHYSSYEYHGNGQRETDKFEATYYYNREQSFEPVSSDSLDAKYVINDDSYKAGLGYLSNTENFYKSALAFTHDEIYNLYFEYFVNIYGAKTNNCFSEDQGAGMGTKVKLWDAENNKYSEYCYISVDEKKAEKILVNGVYFPYNSSFNSEAYKSRLFGNQIDFDELIETLNKINPQHEPSSTSFVPSNENTEGTEPTCMSSGGAKSLGWIVCPALDWINNSVGDIYEKTVKPSLMVQPELFTSGGDNNVRSAWGVFQGFANTIFIILLLVVIFSQVTGVGIDNYGIKKILPKMIIAAIMINLSFLICQICVDVSNIVGNGMQSMFDGLASGLDVTRDGGYTVEGNTISTEGWNGGGLIFAISIFGSIAGAIAVIANPAILLMLLVSGLGILISVLFMFVLLSGRKAAIIILTVLSPVAFAMLMLPNTKKMFDKWLKAWQGLLLLYPICGILIGGGNYMSKLLLVVTGGHGTFETFTAMMVGIMPIFFVPTLMRGAFAAFGNIGARVSGIGKSLSNRATGAIRNNASYKNIQEAGRRRQTRLRAGLNKEGDLVDAKSFRGKLQRVAFSRGGKRGIARARSQYLRDRDELNRIDSLAAGTGAGYLAAQIAQDKRKNADEIQNYMAIVNQRTNNGENKAELKKVYDEFLADNNKSGAIAVARIAGKRKDLALEFMNNNIKTVSDSALNGFTEKQKEVYDGVIKEMSTGENSANYRAADAKGFEYAAAYNKGEAGSTGFDVWSRDGENIKNAYSRHVTDTKQLVGLQKDSLRGMLRDMESGQLDINEIERLSKLAQSALRDASTTGIMDTTKQAELEALASFMIQGPPTATGARPTFSVDNTSSNTANSGAVSVNVSGNSSQSALSGGSFQVNGGQQPSSSGTITISGSPQPQGNVTSSGFILNGSVEDAIKMAGQDVQKADQRQAWKNINGKNMGI